MSLIMFRFIFQVFCMGKFGKKAKRQIGGRDAAQIQTREPIKTEVQEAVLQSAG